MTINTNKTAEPKKFLQVKPSISLEAPPGAKACKKKRIRYVADPHIEPYKKNGHRYYRYRRGIDQPVHLGTAEFVLKAVINYREILRKGE